MSTHKKRRLAARRPSRPRSGRSAGVKTRGQSRSVAPAWVGPRRTEITDQVEARTLLALFVRAPRPVRYPVPQWRAEINSFLTQFTLRSKELMRDRSN